jgi:hypothetical protein
MLLYSLQRRSTALSEKYTVIVLTRLQIINRVAVANVVAVGCTVMPQRVLNKSREIGRVPAVKPARVDVA